MMPPYACLCLCLCLSTFRLAAGEAAVALVNGEAITAGQLAKGIPAGMFGPSRISAQQSRLEQLIEITSLRQHLLSLGATADDAAVAKAFAAKLAAPPVMGCGCCSYRDFDDFLSQVFMTREDARLGIWIDLAIADHAQRTWEHDHPGAEGVAAVLRDQGPAIRSQFRQAWNIGFECDMMEDALAPKPGTASWRRAAAVLARLRAGEPFAAITASLQGDATAHVNLSGVVAPCDTLVELGVASELLAQHPGGLVDAPVAINSRWQIVRWEPLTDDQVLAEIKACHTDRVRRQISSAVQNHTHVQYVGDGLALAPKDWQPTPQAGTDKAAK